MFPSHVLTWTHRDLDTAKWWWLFLFQLKFRRIFFSFSVLPLVRVWRLWNTMQTNQIETEQRNEHTNRSNLFVKFARLLEYCRLAFSCNRLLRPILDEDKTEHIRYMHTRIKMIFPSIVPLRKLMVFVNVCSRTLCLLPLLCYYEYARA